jgi:hypothetical protein
MNLSTKQIAAIAAETKSVCARNGLGKVVAVFADGSFTEAVSANDVIAKGGPNGSWMYRIACFQAPMTRKQVAEALS